MILPQLGVEPGVTAPGEYIEVQVPVFSSK